MRLLKHQETCETCRKKITIAFRVTFGKYYCSARCYGAQFDKG